MKIGIDARCLLDEPRSGVGEYTYNFLTRLFEKDTKNKYILFTSGYGLSRAEKIKNLFSKNANVDFKHLRFPNKIINLLWWLGWGPDIDRLLNVDVMWFPHFNFFKVSKSCRVVVTCHDVSFINLKDLYSLKGRLWHWFVRPLQFYKKARYVLAVSKSTKNDLLSLGIDKKKIKVIYPIVSAKTDQKHINRIELPEKYFFYIGTLDARKNIVSLLEAFTEYNQKYEQDVYLVIAGRLGWHSHSYYQKLFSLLSANKHIIYLGYVDRKDLPHLYRRALAFVYPSFYEGFGFPPLEAMQNGCPVISSFSSSLTEVVKNAAYLIDPYNKADLVHAFKKILSDRDLRLSLIQSGNQVVDFWQKENLKSYDSLVEVLTSF